MNTGKILQALVGGCFFFMLVLISSGKLPAQIVAPEIIQKVEPQDNPNLKSFVIDPTRVKVTVDEFGNPAYLRSDTGLPDNVVQAIEQWHFRPGMKNGNRAEFAIFLDMQLKRPLDKYLESVIPRSDTRWKYPYDAGSKLDPKKAGELEQALGDDEATAAGRSQLLRYAASQSDAASAEMRLRQIVWLVQNQPGAGVLSSSSARIPKGTPGYEEVKKLWLDQVSKNPKDAVVLGHAAWFCSQQIRKSPSDS